MRNEIIAGDTLDFETQVPKYPADDGNGWTLKYRLIPRAAGPAVISFDAPQSAVNTDRYRAQVGKNTTKNWTPANYTWVSYVENSGERYSVDTGEVVIRADLGAVGTTVHDIRTHARKCLDAVEAVLENRATLDQEEFTINSRSLRRTPIPDLLVLKKHYRAEVAAEEAKEARAAGQPTKNRLTFKL